MIINVIDLVLTSILLWWVLTDILMDENIRTRYIRSIILTIIVILAEIGCGFTDNTTPDRRIWSQLFNVIGFSVSPFILLIESNRNEPRIHRSWLYLPATVNALLTILSPLTGLIFFVSTDNVYSRGILFPLYLATFLFSVVISMQNKVLSVRNMPNHFIQRIIVTNLILLSGITIQVFMPDVLITWLTVSIYLLLNYTVSCEMVSMIDGLTKLINRTGFNNMAPKMKPGHKGVSVLFMMDVNDFKSVNDDKGHTYGDYCLREIATILRRTFGSKAIIFRFGGDEFSTLLHMESPERINEYINNLNTEIKKMQKKEPMFPGLATGYYVLDGKNIREVIDRADEMMYKNKRNK